jgi:hypothetical protein
MKLKITFIALIILFINLEIAGQDTALIGVWKGTSICQVKNSPCHNEIAVYHISKTSKPQILSMLMNKLVNNQEEEMGTTDYSYDPVHQTLNSINDRPGAHWEFKIRGDSMHGTLMYNNSLYRIIQLRRIGNRSQ